MNCNDPYIPLIVSSNFSYEERSIDKFLFQRIEAILRLGPSLTTKFLYKLVSLNVLALLAHDSLVHDSKQFEVCWEEYVCLSSIHQISLIIFLLM